MAKEPYRREENEYKSPTFVYCKEANMFVPLVKVRIGTLPIMEGSYSDDKNETLEL
jgi:hypothetical protein